MLFTLLLITFLVKGSSRNRQLHLDINIKSIEKDDDSKWITTWNDYLNDIKYFSRRLHEIKRKQRMNTIKRGNGIVTIIKLGNDFLARE